MVGGAWVKRGDRSIPLSDHRKIKRITIHMPARRAPVSCVAVGDSTTGVGSSDTTVIHTPPGGHA